MPRGGNNKMIETKCTTHKWFGWCSGLILALAAIPDADAIAFTQIIGPSPNISLPAGIGFQPASLGQPDRILISHKTLEPASVQRFGYLDLNGEFTSFGPALSTGVPPPNQLQSKELKLLGIRNAVGQFVPGEVYSSDGSTTKIIRINPDLTVTPITLNPAPGAYVRGFAHDTTGNVIAGDLVCVTANGKVLRVNRSGTATLLCTITGTINGVPNVPLSLEPVLVIPPDSAKYGVGLAGRILVGAEDLSTGSYGCWVVNPATGTHVPLNSLAPVVPMNVKVEDLDIIRANENLYAVDNAAGAVNVLGAELGQFLNSDGDILMTSEENHEMRRLRWTGTSYALGVSEPIQIWTENDLDPGPASGAFEHVVFAPAYVAPKVSITALTGVTVGDSSHPGLFRLHRDHASSENLRVTLRLLGLNPPTPGTATPGNDYTVSWRVAGQATVTPVTPSIIDGYWAIEVTFPAESTPVQDLEILIDAVEASSVPETVAFQVVPRIYNASASKRYLPAAADVASVSIFEAGGNKVYLVPVDLTAHEALAGDQGKGGVWLFRNFTEGDLTVGLTFAGNASFGADYASQIWLTDPNSGLQQAVEFDGTVTFPDGVNTLRVEFLPVDDSRAESNETLTVTLQSGAGYQVASAPTQTVTINDGEDTNQLPALGYWLTELGPIGSTSTYAYGLNTIPDGNGGFRAKVVGNALPASGQSGFRWDNGVSSLLGVPSAWGLLSGTKSSSTFALNDVGTSVGQCMLYNAGTYTNVAAYWSSAATAPTPLAALYAGYGIDNLAQDINQRNVVNGISVGGLIVGQSKRADGKIHAVVWIPNASGIYGNAVDLKDLGDGTFIRNSYAAAINDKAQVVGRSQVAGLNNYHGFVTRSEAVAGQWVPFELDFQVDDMGTATGNETDTSEFNDLNSLGEIVGRGHTASGQMRALYKAPGTGRHAGFFDLKVLGDGTANAGTESVANSISANGLIVGMSKVKVGANQVWRAFVTGNVGNAGSQPLLNLNDHAYVYTGSGSSPVLATGQGWTLVSAERINRRGWIAGYGTKNGQTRAFVLSPW